MTPTGYHCAWCNGDIAESEMVQQSHGSMFHAGCTPAHRYELAEIRLAQAQTRLLEAVRHLRKFVTLVGPRHAMRQEAEQFLAKVGA